MEGQGGGEAQGVADQRTTFYKKVFIHFSFNWKKLTVFFFSPLFISRIFGVGTRVW
jgi:hypothetical protein